MREGWEYKKLGQVCTSDLGKTLNKSKDGGELHPYLCSINILWDKIDLSTLKQACFEADEQEKYTVRKGDLLVCEGGDTGRSAIWDRDETILYQNALHRLRFHESVSPKFVLFYLLYLKDIGEIDNKYSKGVTIKHLVKKALLSIPLPIPPKSTQLSIVSELDKINELIRIKKEQLKDYDTLAQSIFYGMFGDPVENERGWEVKKLKDISRKIGDGLHGTPEYSELDTGWYFINGNNLENGCISIKSTTKKVTDSVRKEYYIEMDDFTLLVSINGTLGKSAFYNGENVILGKSACYIKLNKDVNKLFIYEIIRGEYFKRYAESVCTGTTIRNVSLKAMREFPIIYPPLPLQHSFAQKIEQIEQQKAAIQKTITDLETLLAARMQYWFD